MRHTPLETVLIEETVLFYSLSCGCDRGQMEKPIATLFQGLKDMDPSLMELCRAIDRAYGRGGYLVNELVTYHDYSEFLRAEMIIDLPKFERFMLRFSKLRVQIWSADLTTMEESNAGALWADGPSGKLAMIQQLESIGGTADGNEIIVGVILKMALYIGRTPDATIPEFFFR